MGYRCKFDVYTTDVFQILVPKKASLSVACLTSLRLSFTIFSFQTSSDQLKQSELDQNTLMMVGWLLTDKIKRQAGVCQKQQPKYF